jgi:hypothetical protein
MKVIHIDVQEFRPLCEVDDIGLVHTYNPIKFKGFNTKFDSKMLLVKRLHLNV